MVMDHRKTLCFKSRKKEVINASDYVKIYCLKLRRFYDTDFELQRCKWKICLNNICNVICFIPLDIENEII